MAVFSDWFLPSSAEVQAMYDELYLYAVSDMNAIDVYWTSSENDATTAVAFSPATGTFSNVAKNDGATARLPCRSFTAGLGAYSLRDIGPAGGYIFIVSGTTYYECSIGTGYGGNWSNVDLLIGTTGTAVGTGQANTTAIIGQVGHTDSAAKRCDDLIITNDVEGTLIITISNQDQSSLVFDELEITISNQAAPVIVPGSVGNIPLYRFFINGASSLTYEVFPLNFLSTTIVFEKDKEHQFYRRKFSGSLLFGTNSKVIDYDDGVTVHNRRDDWNLFWWYEQTDPSQRIYLDIHKIIGGATTTYWEGYFSSSDGFFDIDKCTFEVTPIVNDDYDIILAKADIQFNILAVAPTITHAYLIGVIDQTYTRTRRLFDTGVIEYLAQNLIPAVNVVSTFFSDASNYVTSLTNELKYLTIAQKSDIIRYSSSDPATSAMISWNELMDILWTMFQMQWYYDGIDTIYIEHVSYFAHGVGIDLQTDPMTQATNKYSYLKEKMPKYEKFNFMEADNANFVGIAIWYDSGLVDQNPDTNVKTLSIPVTTDLEYIDKNPDAIADEGFVLLACSSTFHVLMGMSPHNFDIRLNMGLSWVNLHDRYFRHNRVLIEGYMNDTLTTFTTAQKTKIQNCSTIVCDEFDPSDEITTELGETYFAGAKALVQLATLHPTGEINLSLLYGPADNAAHVFTEPMFAIIQEDASTCGKFYITLSTAAVGALHVIVTHEVLNDIGVQDCTGGPETWTINNGETESTKVFSLCNSISPGWCVNYAWNILDLTGAGYIVDIVTKCEC